MIIRRIGYKPTVILTAEIFGSPRLTGHLNGKSLEERSGRTRLFRHVAHALPNQVKCRFRYFQCADLFRRENLIRRTVQIIDTTDDKRFVLNAAVGDFTDDHSRLQRRDKLKTLTDGRVEGITQIPVLVVIFFFVRLTRHKAVRFPVHCNARLPAHTEHFGIFFQFINADTAAELIKIYIIRFGQGFRKINPAERFSPCIAHIHQPVPAAVVNHLIGSNLF